jgi:hypothetical protein
MEYGLDWVQLPEVHVHDEGSERIGLGGVALPPRKDERSSTMARTDHAQRMPRQPSDEATTEQIELANQQGHAYKRALEIMTNEVAQDGAEKAAGDYLIACAVEKAEGMYVMRDGQLEWQEPSEKENIHIEVAVRDGADGRFLPGLDVEVSVADASGREIGTHRHPFLWHPWLFHYGRNWELPSDGEYRIRVAVDPPTFERHDRKNGRRYATREVAEFDSVKVETGHK